MEEDPGTSLYTHTLSSPLRLVSPMYISYIWLWFEDDDGSKTFFFSFSLLSLFCFCVSLLQNGKQQLGVDRSSQYLIIPNWFDCEYKDWMKREHWRGKEENKREGGLWKLLILWWPHPRDASRRATQTLLSQKETPSGRWRGRWRKKVFDVRYIVSLSLYL